ncbi:MAG: hypothetical protein ABSD76_04455 [Terriglobales bacterium]
MRSERRFKFSCLGLLVLIALSGRAFSSDTYVVVGPTYNCVGHYAWVPTINQALAAVKGAKKAVIAVCPGTYPEQVVITQQNLTLVGVADTYSHDSAVIMPPATGSVTNTVDLDTGLNIAAQILVQNATGASISNITIDGTGNGIGDCNTDLPGILFQNASGTVNHVVVQNQIPGGSLSNCSTGESVYVQTSTGNVSTVTVENSLLQNYNKNGITGNDPGTTMTLSGNYIVGSGVVSGGAVQNGIQLGYGATGKISTNTVSDNNNDGPPYAADILLIDTAENGGISVSNNILSNSQLPLGLETDFANGPSEYGDGVTVTGNKVFGASIYDGIDVCTNGNKVTTNLILNSAESGVHLDASCGATYGGGTLFTGNNNTLTGNTMEGGSCAGILEDTGTSGNSIVSENYYAVPLTLTSSTSSCPIATGPAHTKAKTALKFSPKK